MADVASDASAGSAADQQAVRVIHLQTLKANFHLEVHRFPDAKE
jgi:hypothetical protein